MIESIKPERGGEAEGILRVDISLPIAPDELAALGVWFAENGWSIEAEQIEWYFATGEEP